MCKTCSSCKQIKSVIAFHKNRARKDGYSEVCAPCRNEYEKKWREKNKENKRATNRKYRENYPERARQSTAKYRVAHKYKGAARTAKYLAAKKFRTPLWLTSLQLSHIELFYESAARLTIELGIAVEVDHIIPLQGELISGLHVPWNLQVLPKTVNAAKRNRL